MATYDLQNTILYRRPLEYIENIRYRSSWLSENDD
jgi:hypothetical protein